MGAWIETWLLGVEVMALRVAPYVGAWIETQVFLSVMVIVLSHPTWVRGLKRYRNWSKDYFTWSHPTWVRGLKLT